MSEGKTPALNIWGLKFSSPEPTLKKSGDAYNFYTRDMETCVFLGLTGQPVQPIHLVPGKEKPVSKDKVDGS